SSRAMRRGPFHHHHQPARLPNLPPPVHFPSSAERRLVVSTATLANQRHMCASFARALRCHRLYGDITVKSAPDRKLFSARTCGGQRGGEKSIGDRSLTLSHMREPFRPLDRAQRGPYMRTANAGPLLRAQPLSPPPRYRGASASSGDGVCRKRRVCSGAPPRERHRVNRGGHDWHVS